MARGQADSPQATQEGAGQSPHPVFPHPGDQEPPLQRTLAAPTPQTRPPWLRGLKHLSAAQPTPLPEPPVQLRGVAGPSWCPQGSLGCKTVVGPGSSPPRGCPASMPQALTRGCPGDETGGQVGGWGPMVSLQDPERGRGQPSRATGVRSPVPGQAACASQLPAKLSAGGAWQAARRSGEGCLQTAADSFPAEAALVKQKKRSVLPPSGPQGGGHLEEISGRGLGPPAGGLFSICHPSLTGQLQGPQAVLRHHHHPPPSPPPPPGRRQRPLEQFPWKPLLTQVTPGLEGVRRRLNSAEPHLTSAGTPTLPHLSALSARSPSGRRAPTRKPMLVTWGPSH
ncbi:large proline-rich protein BAG6-like [Eumetopias jubatus]|uniref:large proline-rich protein BAG6-like n=1 Tax=Eumetopias jubatus TaxID=34886 RepID=UPI001015DD26|nr:large proline-rich protein BAG6-like [Eumetopias jubatus]